MFLSRHGLDYLILSGMVWRAKERDKKMKFNQQETWQKYKQEKQKEGSSSWSESQTPKSTADDRVTWIQVLIIMWNQGETQNLKTEHNKNIKRYVTGIKKRKPS